MARDTVPAAPARPLRRDAELNRRRIIDSARVVFGSRGLEATLDDIAHHAGLGVGTVYRRFPGKEQLVEAMFAERMDEIGEVAKKALEAEDPWQGFVDFMWSAAQMHAGDRGLREVMLSNAFGHLHVAEAKARTVPMITAIVERAQQAGQLRADFRATDLPLLHQMIGSVVEYTHVTETHVWKRCLALLLDGLRAEPGKASELPEPPLDMETLDNAMCNFRLPRTGQPSGASR